MAFFARIDSGVLCIVEGCRLITIARVCLFVAPFGPGAHAGFLLSGGWACWLGHASAASGYTTTTPHRGQAVKDGRSLPLAQSLTGCPRCGRAGLSGQHLVFQLQLPWPKMGAQVTWWD